MLGLGLLHRMIFWELLKVFLLSLIGLTGLFMLGGLIQQMNQLGLNFSQTIRIIPMMIVISLPYTIPATTLFASCVTYGRISGDNEAVALKAAGVDLLTVLRPAILLGLLATATTYYLATVVIPLAHQRIQVEIMRDPEQVMYNWLAREKRLVGGKSNYSVYVDNVQGRRLLDVIVKRKNSVRMVEGIGPRAEYDYVARTNEARLIVDLEERTLTLDAEKWTVSSPNSSMETQGSRPEKIPLPEMFNDSQIKSKPMFLESSELADRLRELKQERESDLAKQKIAIEAAARDTNPANKESHNLQLLNYVGLLKENQRQIRNVEYEHASRPALAVGCLIFAIIGCPMALWFSRSDYLSITVVCFLPTVLVYYPLMLSGGGMSKDGKVPMLVGVWWANAIVGIMAFLLCRRLIKR